MVAELFQEIHEDYRRAVREFIEKEIVPYVEEWEEKEQVPRSLYERMGELGFLGASYPEEYGGGGEDRLMDVVLFEEMSRVGAGGGGAGITVHVAIAMSPILKFGTEEQKKKYLVGGIKGEMIGALAVTEPDAGSDVASIKTTAVRDGDEYVINGSKMFITNGLTCDFVVTAVKTKKDAGYAGISQFIIDRDAPGFEVGRKLEKVGMKSSDTAELYFNDCRVPASALLGEENKGFFNIMSGFGWERLVLAVASVASAELILKDAIDYAKERQQFGRPIAKFQAISHRLADMAIMVESSRQLTYHCLKKVLVGEECLAEVAMAKVLATETTFKVADEALQIHGGYGYMMEYPVQRHWRDARIGRIFAGTNEIMREIIAKSLTS